jgi:hypothetical protein
MTGTPEGIPVRPTRIAMRLYRLGLAHFLCGQSDGRHLLLLRFGFRHLPSFRRKSDSIPPFAFDQALFHGVINQPTDTVAIFGTDDARQIAEGSQGDTPEPVIPELGSYQSHKVAELLLNSREGLFDQFVEVRAADKKPVGFRRRAPDRVTQPGPRHVVLFDAASHHRECGPGYLIGAASRATNLLLVPIVPIPAALGRAQAHGTRVRVTAH